MSNNQYLVKDGLGNVKNTIIADETFMSAHYSNYEIKEFTAGAPDPEVLARMWRNNMLEQSDNKVMIADHPDVDAYKAWRKELRDWPSTESFPDKPPELFPK